MHVIVSTSLSVHNQNRASIRSFSVRFPDFFYFFFLYFFSLRFSLLHTLSFVISAHFCSFFVRLSPNDETFSNKKEKQTNYKNQNEFRTNNFQKGWNIQKNATITKHQCSMFIPFESFWFLYRNLYACVIVFTHYHLVKVSW